MGKHEIGFFGSTGVAASNNKEIAIPFVSFSSLYHLLGPTQCNKSRLLPNYSLQDVGPYMLSINPLFKEYLHANSYFVEGLLNCLEDVSKKLNGN